ncbi:MAG: hypothetical protein NTZ11_11520 [Gammaproteobacteria bacterium]|nr:hypothetical protein [Gammaproteobacteria bacterium]
MPNVNIAVTKPAGNLVVAPLAADSTTGTTLVWTLDPAIAGSFDTGQPFAWHPDSVPPAGTCSTPTLSNANKTLSLSILSATSLNLAYKLFVRMSNGKIVTTVFGPPGTEPVGAGNMKIPPVSPKIRNR